MQPAGENLAPGAGRQQLVGRKCLIYMFILNVSVKAIIISLNIDIEMSSKTMRLSTHSDRDAHLKKLTLSFRPHLSFFGHLSYPTL